MKNHPDLELIAVVVVIPSILNSICFWVTDNFLRGDSASENMSLAKKEKENINENQFEELPNTNQESESALIL